MEFFHSEDPRCEDAPRADMDGFLKFVYQGVYDSREQHRPGTSFPVAEREREKKRGKPN